MPEFEMPFKSDNEAELAQKQQVETLHLAALPFVIKELRRDLAGTVSTLNETRKAASAMLAALKNLKTQLHAANLKLNVRKHEHFRLLVADAAGGTAIAAAEAAGIKEEG